MTIDWLLERLSAFSDSEAIVWGDRSSTYGDLLDTIEHWKHRLDEAGVHRGQVVTIEGDYSPRTCALLLALIDRGAIIVPLTTAVGAQRDEFLDVAEVQVVFSFDDADGWHVEHRDASVANPLTLQLVRQGRPGLVLFSSGSTGKSKAALHDFTALLEKFKVRRHSMRTLTFLLLDHIGGINTLLYTLSNAGTVISVESRDPDAVCAAIERHRAQLLPTSPTFLNLLVMSEAYARHDLSSLELVTYGTEVMPESTLRRLHEVLPGVRLLQTYGLSEIGILRSKSRDSDSLWVKVGGEGFETKIVDGVLYVRAQSAMLGYLNAPSPFDAEGWLCTEDVVEEDGEWIRILGRRSDIINVGGEKVYPAEVESVLMQLDNVVGATVYGERNPVTGQIVVARITVRSTENLRDLKRRIRVFCLSKLARYKVPIRVEIAEHQEVSARFKKVRSPARALRSYATQRVRIAIDPVLMQRHGPEVSWTWRLLLSGIGFAWEEVRLGSPCDIAYVVDPRLAEGARVCVIAEPRAWEKPCRVLLDSVDRIDGWMLPSFDGAARTRAVFEHRDGAVTFHRDIVFSVYWLATRQLEAHLRKDQHGFVDLGGTTLQREGALRLALASGIARRLEAIFAELGLDQPLPRWPAGKRAAACLTHDVDYPEAMRWLEPVRVLLRRGRDGFRPAVELLAGRRTHWHFSSWVELEKRFGYRSAFYFVARRGSLLRYLAGTPDPFYDVGSPRFRSLFSYLSDEGAEIGLQASYLAYQSLDALRAEKARLEEASGRPVEGNRHHYWHLDPADPEATLELHEVAGFRYDTSLIHDRHVGWRSGLTWPFFPFLQRQRREIRTLQLAPAWMDEQLFGKSRRDNPGDPVQTLVGLVETTIEQEGCLAIAVHEYLFDDSLHPGRAATYRILLEQLASCSDLWVGTPGEITDHWLKRHSLLESASRGLGV